MSSLTLTHPTPAHPLAVAPPQAHPLTTITEGVNKSNMGVVKHADAYARPAGTPTPSPKSEIVDADNTDVGTVNNKKRKAAEIYSPEPKRSRNTAWEYGIRLQDAFAGEDWSIVDKWESGKPFSGIQEERAYRRFAGIMRNFKAAEADREAEAAEEAAADAEIAAIDAACDQEASAMDMRIAHGMTALTPLGVGVHTRFESDSEDSEDEEEEEETSAPAEPPAEKSEFIINTENNTVTLPMIDLTSSDSEDEEEPEAPEEPEEPTNPQEPPQGNPTPQGNPQDKVTRFVAIHRSGKGQSVRLPPIDTPAPAPSLRPRKKNKSDALRKLMYEVSATWQASQRHVTEWRRV